METKTIINRAKKVHQNVKLMINGYIRSIIGQQNIILMINYLIITFYCIIDRFTLSNEQQNYLSLTNNGKRINVTQDSIYKLIPGKNNGESYPWAKYTIIYCNDNIIESQDTSIAKYQWSIKFRDGPYNAISFGIISSQPRYVQGIRYEWKQEGMKYHKVYSHGLISNYYYNSSEIGGTTVGELITPGIIQFDLDVNQQKLSFKHEASQTRYTISNKVDISSTKFCFAVEIPILRTSSIEMMDFTIKHNYLPHAFKDIMDHLPQHFQFEVPPETTLNQDWISIFSNQYIQ